MGRDNASPEAKAERARRRNAVAELYGAGVVTLSEIGERLREDHGITTTLPTIFRDLSRLRKHWQERNVDLVAMQRAAIDTGFAQIATLAMEGYRDSRKPTRTKRMVPSGEKDKAAAVEFVETKTSAGNPGFLAAAAEALKARAKLHGLNLEVGGGGSRGGRNEGGESPADVLEVVVTSRAELSQLLALRDCRMIDGVIGVTKDPGGGADEAEPGAAEHPAEGDGGGT